MYQDIREKIPQINIKIDFEKGWSGLNPVQVEMLKYINGIASVEVIFRVLDASLVEATDAITDLVDKEWVFLEDEDLSGEFEELLLDDLPSDSLEGAQSFDSIPDEMIDISESESDFDAVPSMEAKEKVTVRTDAQQKIPAGKRVRMPAISGEQLPKFLMKAFHDGDDHSYRFFYGPNKSLVVDFFRGNLIRIVPRPLEPRMFLGVLLVKMNGMGKEFIARSVDIVRKEGVLQGEALLRLGACAPKTITNMISYQAKWRIMQLLQSEKIGYRIYPGRVHRKPDVRLDWRPAMFHTVWHNKSDEWLMEWAKENGNCIVEKVNINSTLEYGLGTETADFLQTGVVSGSPISDYLQKQGLKAEVSIRAVYAYFRVGVIRLVRPDGRELDADEIVESFDTITDIESSTGSQTSHAMGQPGIEEIRKEVSESQKPLNFSSSIEDELEKDVDEDESELPTKGIHEIPPPEPEEKDEEETTEPEKTPAIEVKAVREDLKERKRKQIIKRQRMRESAQKKFDTGIDAFNHGNWKVAGRNFNAASKRDPENPLYPAYKAFCLYAHRKDLDTARNYVAEIKNYGEMGEDGTPDYAFLQGLIYKIANDIDKAVLYFRKALLEDPDHHGSLREVRSYNLAKQKEKDEQQSGLFARAFGKKK